MLTVGNTHREDKKRKDMVCVLTEKEMYEFVSGIESPYDNILNQFNVDNEVKEFLSENEDVDKFDLSLMIPKVSYDDWIVCLYLKDNRLYCISDVDISEVKPVSILMYNDNFEVLKENGEVMSDDEIMECYEDYSYAGEADDMRSYIFFQ